MRWDMSLMSLIVYLCLLFSITENFDINVEYQHTSNDGDD